MKIELEVKVLGMNFEELEKEVIKQGGKLIAEEEQVNTLIDSKERPIKSYLDAYFRIRESKDLLKNKSKTTLTLKKNIGLNRVRQNEELNTSIGDRDIMLEILKNLGFDSIQVGNKHRKSYDLMGARLDFDTWDKDTYPYPYMEIEVADARDLNKIRKILNIPEENISTKSINELRAELKLV